MSLLDVLFGWLPHYRKARGGRWELTHARVIASSFWVRVDLPTPTPRGLNCGEFVVRREDHRR